MSSRGLGPASSSIRAFGTPGIQDRHRDSCTTHSSSIIYFHLTGRIQHGGLIEEVHIVLNITPEAEDVPVRRRNQLKTGINHINILLALIHP